MRVVPGGFPLNRRFASVLSVAVLACALPVFGQLPPAFESFVVSGSNSDVPSVLAETSEAEDSLNIQICDELGEGRPPDAVAHELHLSPAELQAHIDALVRAELLRPGTAGSYTPTFPIIHAIKTRERELRARFGETLPLDAEQGRALSHASVPAFAAGQDKDVRSKDGRMTSVPKRLQRFVGSAPSDAGLVTIFANIGRAYPKGSYSCCDAFTVTGPVAQPGPEAWEAAAFKPAANHTVTKLEVAVGLNTGTNAVVLSLNKDANGLPGMAIKTWQLTHLSPAGQCCTVEAKEDAVGIPVTAGKQYWIVVSTPKGSDFQGGWNVNDTNQVNSIKTAFYCSGVAGSCQNNHKWTVEQSIPGPAFAVLGSD